MALPRLKIQLFRRPPGGVFAFFAHGLTFLEHFGKIELLFDGLRPRWTDSFVFGFQLSDFGS